jgi:hypothetical protein
MEHKVKIVEVLERHKIHRKAKAWMNTPLPHDIHASCEASLQDQCAQD